MKITIGIPAYNEEKNIAGVISKLKKFADTIIVCDDGSNDLTGDISKQLGAVVITHSKNKGYGAAINSLFLKAKEIQSDVFVTFDADGQHRIEDVETVIKPILNGEADLVIGSRFLNTSEKEVPGYRKIGINIITKVTNSGLKEKITDSQSGFRAYSRELISNLDTSNLGMGISTEILIKTSSLGFKIAEVPITIIYEGKTSTHNPISHGTSVLFSTIKYTSIEHPLKFYGIPSLVFFGIGLFFTYLSVQFYSEVGRLSTNLTLIAAVTMLLAVVLVITAILLFALVNVVRDSVKS